MSESKIRKFAMDIDHRIVKGDRVTINFYSSSSLYDVEVLSLPMGFGDPWVVRGGGGEIYYVGLYETITKVVAPPAVAYNDTYDEDLPF